MRSQFSRYFSAIVMVLTCLSCGAPEIKIAQDTVYSEPIPKSNTEYIVGPGDVIEIVYLFENSPTKVEYTIAVGDVFDIEFFYHPEMNRRVKVRSDGRITLPLKGEIVAVGLTPTELGKKITDIFSVELKKPMVTINLIEYNLAVKQLKDALRSDTRGQVKLVTVRPDGFINFPLIDEVRATGRTINDLETIVSGKYSEILESLSVSILMQDTKSNLVYVMGEVKKPDYYLMQGPTSVTQILARAGGILDSAEKKSILVVTRNEKNQSMGRLVDIDKILTEGNMAGDILLKQYDVVYVPKSRIANANMFVDQYINKIIPNAFRFNAGIIYRIDEIND